MLKLSSSGRGLMWRWPLQAADMREAAGQTILSLALPLDDSLEVCATKAAILDVVMARAVTPPPGAFAGGKAHQEVVERRPDVARKFDPELALQEGLTNGLASDPLVQDRRDMFLERLGGCDPRRKEERRRRLSPRSERLLQTREATQRAPQALPALIQKRAG